MSVASRAISIAREQSPTVWVLQLGMLVNFFGNGLVGPFLVLYLYLGRGVPLALAAAAIASGGVIAVASGFLAGWSADRFGPKLTLVAAMTSNAIAYALYLTVSEPWQAFVVAGLVGFGTGMYGPSQQSLVAVLVPAERRHRVFTQNRMFSLLGLGLGGIVGGLIAAGGRLADYETLLVLDVATFLVFALVLRLLPVPSAPPAARAAGGYVDALRDGDLGRLCLVNLALVSAGIAPMLVLMPAYAKLHGDVGLGTIGLIYAANTVAVLVGQVPITRLAEGRRRMPFLAFGTGLWVIAWLVMLVGVIVLRPWAGLLFGMAVVLYALGECMYSAVVVPTVAAIAPDHLRGRYLAVMGFTWQGGFLIGPAIGGVLVASGPVALPVVAATVCVVALVGALASEGRFRPEHQRTPHVTVSAAAAADPKGAPRWKNTRWITREHPRVDRVACPWFIRRFVDPASEFHYVPAPMVTAKATQLGATPYDIEGAQLGHHGPECSFDAFVRLYDRAGDPALAYMAKVIRGADTDAKDLTPESRGIEALLEGIRQLHYPDDQGQREASRPILDALYAYCATARVDSGPEFRSRR